MEKPAITDKNIHPILKRRWSPRAFDSRLPEREKLERIFEAGRWAPSSGNEQPWRFMLGFRGDKTWQNIFDSLDKGNQQWASNLPILVLSIGNTLLERNGKENIFFKYDVGQAVAHITFQVYEEGLVMHQMGGFYKEKAIAHFNLPPHYEPLTVFTIGYQGDPALLPPKYERREYNKRYRRPLSHQVFTGSIGQAVFPEE